MCQCEHGSRTELDERFATSTDFCNIVVKELRSLHKLAFLLTTNYAQAQECILLALDHAFEEQGVHIEWAQCWTKRAVIKNAIRIVFGDAALTERTREHWVDSEPGSLASSMINGITRLAPLERFLYVLSVLEKFSDRECSVMLSCCLDDVAEGRIRALRRLPTFDAASRRQSGEMPIPLQSRSERLGELVNAC